jgi:hypothetical protein
MTKIAEIIDTWLGQYVHFQQLVAEMGVEVPTISWTDDIAVPLASREAGATVPLLQEALTVIRKFLLDAAFLLNLSKGKTSAILTLRGPGSYDLRKQYQLCPNPGVNYTFDDGNNAWLYFVSRYKYLGIMFLSKYDLMYELRTRVGVAKAAFAQLSKSIPSKARSQG